MIRRITTKLIIVYLLILVSVFVLLNISGSKSLEKKLLLQKKEVLMQEARMIAGEYGEGYVNSKLVLKENETFFFLYKTPFGDLDMAARLIERSDSLTDLGGTVYLKYEMFLSGEKTAENQLTLEISIK